MGDYLVFAYTGFILGVLIGTVSVFLLRTVARSKEVKHKGFGRFSQMHKIITDESVLQGSEYQESNAAKDFTSGK